MLSRVYICVASALLIITLGNGIFKYQLYKLDVDGICFFFRSYSRLKFYTGPRARGQ